MALGIALACVLVCMLGYLLRQIGSEADPLVWASSQLIAAVLSFTIAANVVLRFYGTGDRSALLVGLAVGVSGLTQLGGIIELLRHFSSTSAQQRVPLSWMVGGTLLGLLLAATRVLDRRLPWPRDAKRTLGAALSVVVAGAMLIALAFALSPEEPLITIRSSIPRPWDLLPAGIFVVATVILSRRAHRQDSAFHAVLAWTAGAHAGAYLLASQSVRLLDVPAMAAQLLVIASHALLLTMTLLENTRLFGQVRQRATSDSLTGLANYAQFLHVLQNEMERSGRTNRPFSLLLMDLDGLKQINDNFGHLTGTESLFRVARILQQECRSIDTAARYGGDEFALILPETNARAAREVAARIRKRIHDDPRWPRLNISIGTATHPDDGLSADLLLETADQQLYAAKAKSRSRRTSRSSPRS
jgi:diguanylate cyclase (GGDEF)-like protein